MIEVPIPIFLCVSATVLSVQLFRCRESPNPLCTRVTFEALMRASTNHSLVAWTACLTLDLNTQSSAWEVSGSNTTPPGTNKPANLQVFGAVYGTMHIKLVIRIFDVAVWWDVTVTNTHHFTWWQLKILTADHLTTAQSVKPTFYQTRGWRPRVDDMTVLHDEHLLNIIVQRHILVWFAHVTTYIGHVAQFLWIGFLSEVS